MRYLESMVPDRADRVPLIVFTLFLVVLAIGGGGSRADILGQAVARAGAVAAMLAVLLAGCRVSVAEYRLIALPLAVMALLITAQLVPLPPSIWSALPGRHDLTGVMSIAGLAQPARPVALVPDAALNALFSLLVPTAMLAILASLTRATSNRVLLPVLMWITASALLALLQAAGTMPDNPLINAAGDYAGFFANRNHQALFLAIGVVLSLFWGFERGAHWRSRRMWFAFAIAALLFVSILITGSRSGLFVGILGLLIALPFAQRGAFATGGCKRTAIILAGAVVLIAVAIYSSVYAGRALSIDRATAIPITGEFRLRALPTVWHLVETYFPVGSGFGSFDAVFRMAEPMDLLEPTYFNHAHNDWLEVVIEGGLPALLILGVTLVAFIRAAVAVFAGRKGDHPDVRQGRLGALIIVMVFVASVSDYPARTPIIMGVLVIAACWLCRGTWTARAGNAASHGTLPLQGESV